MDMASIITRIRKALSGPETARKAFFWQKHIDLNKANRISLREDFIVSRRYGGGLFTPRARRYYRIVIIDSLRPFIGFTYPVLRDKRKILCVVAFPFLIILALLFMLCEFIFDREDFIESLRESL